MAIRAIDQKRGGLANEGHFYERKIALLAKEDQIEADFEKMVTLPLFVFLLFVVLNVALLLCTVQVGHQAKAVQSCSQHQVP